MTILLQRDAIVAAIKADIAAFNDVDVFGGELDEESIKRYAVKSPAARVACLGLGGRLEGGEYVMDLKWVIAIITRDTATKRGAQLLTLAQAVNKLVLGNDWGMATGSPKEVVGANLFSGTLDGKGVALWVVAWNQRLEADEFDLSALEDFNLATAKWDLAPRDGIFEAEDRVELRGTWMSAYGQLTMDTPIATGISVAGTYQKAAGTTALGDADGMDSPVTGRLRHTGTVPKPFMVTASVAVTVSADAKVTLAFAKDGVVDEDTAIEHEVAAASDPVAFGLTDIVSLDASEYTEIWATADDTVNVTLTKMSLIAGAN